MKRWLLLILIIVSLLPKMSQAQDTWTCDNGPNDVLNAAQDAQNKGDLTRALELAKIAVDVCKDNPVRQGQAQLMVAQLEQELAPTATPNQDSADPKQMNNL